MPINFADLAESSAAPPNQPADSLTPVPTARSDHACPESSYYVFQSEEFEHPDLAV